MDSKSEKNLKVFSKIIYVVAIISKIAVAISAVAILVCMMFIPTVINKIEVKDHVLIYDNEEIMNLDEIDNIKIDDEEFNIEYAKVYIDKILSAFSESGHVRIILFIEVALVVTIASLVVTFLMLCAIEKLFKNISDYKTPFTMENSNLIKKVAFYFAFSILIGAGGSVLLGLILRTSFNLNISLMSIMEFLGILVLSYIFEYGVYIQGQTKEEKKAK